MIVDKLCNIDKYSQIPDYARDFINNLVNDIELGRYDLDNNSYANVETYMTKKLDEGKFEKHNKYIDVQILLSGKERIYIKPAEALTVPGEYNEQKDIRFYDDEIENSDFVTLDGSNFVLIYPHEVHAPQIALNEISQMAKKVVVKLFL